MKLNFVAEWGLSDPVMETDPHELAVPWHMEPQGGSGL